jgi:hypothetical protein
MMQNAKKEVERAEIALQRMRAKAAALLAPELPKHSKYVHKILRHRETGVRVRVLDTQAPDAPAGLFDLPLRYVVECETHGGSPQSYATAGAAMSAARRSYEWCQGCADLMAARPSTRSRARTHGHGHGMHGHGHEQQSMAEHEQGMDEHGERHPHMRGMQLRGMHLHGHGRHAADVTDTLEMDSPGTLGTSRVVRMPAATEESGAKGATQSRDAADAAEASQASHASGKATPSDMPHAARRDRGRGRDRNKPDGPADKV